MKFKELPEYEINATFNLCKKIFKVFKSHKQKALRILQPLSSPLLGARENLSWTQSKKFYIFRPPLNTMKIKTFIMVKGPALIMLFSPCSEFFKDIVPCKRDASTFLSLNLTSPNTSPTSPNRKPNRRRNKEGHGKGWAAEVGMPSLGLMGGQKEGRKFCQTEFKSWGHKGRR